MIDTILILMLIMLPSILFGYCIRWMMDEERIAKENLARKMEEDRIAKENLEHEMSELVIDDSNTGYDNFRKMKDNDY